LTTALSKCNIASHNYISDENRDSVAADNQVRICTYHSARGIEAKIVVLLDLTTLEEANRELGTTENLLYIALTRSLRETYIVEMDEVESASGRMLKQVNTEVTKLFSTDISKHWFRHAQMDEVVQWTKERYGHGSDENDSLNNAIDFDSEVSAIKPPDFELSKEINVIHNPEEVGGELVRWIRAWLTPITRKWMRGASEDSTN
jgi:superfamily I DNA/RNA helicase